MPVYRDAFFVVAVFLLVAVCLFVCFEVGGLVLGTDPSLMR